MISLQHINDFLKELSRSLTVQAAVAIAFGLSLILLVFFEKSVLTVTLALVCMLALGTLIGSLIEIGLKWRKDRNQRRLRSLEQKAGYLGKLIFTHLESTPFPDPKFEGLGWIVAINQQVPTGYLTEPACTVCKCDMVRKFNSKADGINLECVKCNVVHEVDDVGQARGIAETVFKGDLRNNPRKYYRAII